MKHGIKAPRKSYLESKDTTILNQEKQVKLLFERCVKLETERNDALVKLSAKDCQHRVVTDMLEDRHQQYIELEDAYSRLSGWQDCAREILGTRGLPVAVSES